MNEQIIVTQGDYGVRIDAQFKDNKKQPVDISGCNIELNIKRADDFLIETNAIIENATLGMCYFILDMQMTEVSDLATCYVKAVDDNNNIHAQDSVYYYVMPLNGGN